MDTAQPLITSNPSPTSMPTSPSIPSTVPNTSDDAKLDELKKRLEELKLQTGLAPAPIVSESMEKTISSTASASSSLPSTQPVAPANTLAKVMGSPSTPEPAPSVAPAPSLTPPVASTLPTLSPPSMGSKLSESQVPNEPAKKSSFKLVLLIILVLAVLAGVGFAVYQSMNTSTTTSTTPTTESVQQPMEMESEYPVMPETMDSTMGAQESMESAPPIMEGEEAPIER